MLSERVPIPAFAPVSESPGLLAYASCLYASVTPCLQPMFRLAQ
jgi:hypothetical protein